MTDVDAIFQAIRGLPVRERLRLVERVIHDLAEASSTAEQVAPPCAGPSPLGLFADDPDEVDEMMKVVMENRRRERGRRRFGSAAGQIRMSPDFDAPLEDFE